MDSELKYDDDDDDDDDNDDDDDHLPLSSSWITCTVYIVYKEHESTNVIRRSPVFSCWEQSCWSYLRWKFPFLCVCISAPTVESFDRRPLLSAAATSEFSWCWNIFQRRGRGREREGWEREGRGGRARRGEVYIMGLEGMNAPGAVVEWLTCRFLDL